MPLFVWSDKLFSVNVDVIDKQHKRLVQLLNLLHDAMLKGEGRDVLGPVLGELVRYTGYHFDTEEQLMLEYAYPGYSEHKAEHDALKQRALAFVRDYEANKLTVTVELSMFLSEWLQHHIQGTDKALGEFLNRKRHLIIQPPFGRTVEKP